MWGERCYSIIVVVDLQILEKEEKNVYHGMYSTVTGTDGSIRLRECRLSVVISIYAHTYIQCKQFKSKKVASASTFSSLCPDSSSYLMYVYYVSQKFDISSKTVKNFVGGDNLDDMSNSDNYSDKGD